MHCPIACDKCDVKCDNFNGYCDEWARAGECYKNREYMGIYCKKVSGTIYTLMSGYVWGSVTIIGSTWAFNVRR